MTSESPRPPIDVRQPGAASLAVEVQGLTRAFGRVQAVAGVSLGVRSGERVALLGPNGAGKTTLISLMLGLLPADRGEVRLFDAEPRAAVRAGRVGAVLQDGGLMPGARVGELLTLMRRLYASPVGVDEVLEMTQLTEVRRRRADRLSGGQTQRVRAALALIGNPDLLVLDEPTAGLDVEARRNFWSAVDEQAARGRTVLFSTHYLQEVDGHSERVLVLAGGRLVADGPPAAIRASVGLRRLRYSLPGLREDDARALPGAASVTVRGDRAEVLSRDTDAALRVLLMRHPAARDIEVSGVDLEDAFLALTERTQGRAA